MPKSRLSAARITLRLLPADEIPLIFPLIHLLNPEITRPLFMRRLKAMVPLGYQVVAAFKGEKLVGASGFWVGMRFWCGKQFDIDNFVVHPHYRNQKIGDTLMRWLEKKAIAEGAELMVLDVYTHNTLAQRFYHRAGFTVTGYHFTKIPGSSKPYGL